MKIPQESGIVPVEIWNGKSILPNKTLKKKKERKIPYQYVCAEDVHEFLYYDHRLL